MTSIGAFFPTPFAPKPAPAAPAAPKPAAPAADSLSLTAKPAAPAKPAAKPVEIVQPVGTMGAVLGVGSAGVAVGFAAWGLASVFPAVALPILGGAAVLGGLLTLAGVGVAKNWGNERPWLHGLMTRFAGAVGVAGCMVGGGIAMSMVAASMGPGIGIICYAAMGLAELCMGALAYGMFKAPVQTPGLPVKR